MAAISQEALERALAKIKQLVLTVGRLKTTVCLFPLPLPSPN